MRDVMKKWLQNLISSTADEKHHNLALHSWLFVEDEQGTNTHFCRYFRLVCEEFRLPPELRQTIHASSDIDHAIKNVAE